MESASSRRSLLPRASGTSSRKSLLKRIEPAIWDKSCPICLGRIDHRRAAVITACLHPYCVDCIRRWSDLKRKCPVCNAKFDAWFFKIDLRFGTFVKQRLPALADNRKVQIEGSRGIGRCPLSERRILRRSREEFNCGSWQTRPLPRRRWFRRSESEPSDAVAERVLQWRVSIYEQQLQAVPCFPQSCLGKNITANNVARERILQKIEPWIRRELQAILGDPDPSIIVHVASSLFLSSLEEKHGFPAQQAVLEDNYLEPLQRFLHERTHMFWHELRKSIQHGGI
ncbi:uncharacterized protein LOC127799148 isoform X2 [Diospyros lotus]|uniref:uncharacterized protein LOC127799148 isoform X2 n=1 Tax=Diospyros lotus TaxID=55363 RepID=UPI00224DB9A4|nr:uncharacterized protein LOC127799148 isoform X2 [Diospyros lotus]